MNVYLLSPYNPYSMFGGTENVVRVLHKSLKEEGLNANIIYPKVKTRSQLLRVLNVLRIIKKEQKNIDILHTHAWIGAVNYFNNTPSIHTNHGTTYGWLKNCKEFIPFNKRIYKKIVTKNLEKIACKYSSKIVSISDNVYKEVIQGYKIKKDKVIKILNGVDTERFTPRDKEESRKKLNLPKDKEIILTTGRMDVGQKGFDLYSRIIKSLRNENYLPLINGKIQKGSERYKPKNAMINYIPLKELREKLPLVYNSSDVFIQTSRYEGCSISLLEAIASGVPVVSFDTGAASELIKDGKNGFVINNFDVSAFSDKLKFILERKEKFAKRAIIYSKKMKKEISEEKMTKEYIKAYERLI